VDIFILLPVHLIDNFLIFALIHLVHKGIPHPSCKNIASSILEAFIGDFATTGRL